MTITKQNYGKRIRQRRRELDMTQAKLAEKLTITRAHLSNIERGTAHASVPLLVELEEKLGIQLLVTEQRPVNRVAS